MCDWEWGDMAMAGLLGEMIADEELERIFNLTRINLDDFTQILAILL